VSFWGELYRRTEQRSAAETAKEVAAVLRAFEPLPLRAPILDVGAGDGRHIRELRANGRNAHGVDFDDGVTNGDVAMGDMRSLPFPDAHFAAAYSLRNTAFGFNEADLRRVWSEMTRVVRMGGLIFVTQTRRAWAERHLIEPIVTTAGDTVEQAMFYRGWLMLRREHGQLWGDLSIRLLEPEEWAPWLRNFGLELAWLTETETETHALARRTLTRVAS
jgi:hypothetical protein